MLRGNEPYVAPEGPGDYGDEVAIKEAFQGYTQASDDLNDVLGVGCTYDLDLDFDNTVAKLEEHAA